MTDFSVIKQILQNISYTNITNFLKNKILKDQYEKILKLDRIPSKKKK